jgi:hypothetical protein
MGRETVTDDGKIATVDVTDRIVGLLPLFSSESEAVPGAFEFQMVVVVLLLSGDGS